MDPNAAGPDMAGLLLWFLAILALIPLTLWFVRRSPWGMRAGGGLVGGLVRRGSRADRTESTDIRVLGHTPVAPGQRVVVVEVRHGGLVQTLVLGSTAQQLTHLSTLPSTPGSVLRETA